MSTKLTWQQKKMHYIKNKPQQFEMAIEELQKTTEVDVCRHFVMLIASSLWEMPAGLTRDRAMLVMQKALVDCKASLQGSKLFEVYTNDWCQ